LVHLRIAHAIGKHNETLQDTTDATIDGK
jgi:hypothetical protein